MKKNVPLTEYLQKVREIANVWNVSENDFPKTPMQLNSIVSTSQKKTKEEWKQEKQQRVRHKIERAKEYLNNCSNQSAGDCTIK
jgi:hypothetical protein